jgi:chitodextrinase
MSTRKLVALGCAVALTVVVNVATVVAGRGGSGGSATGPTNLRITGGTDTSVSLAWDAAKRSGTWWYCVQKGGQGCVRVDPPTTTVTLTTLLPDTTSTYTVVAVSSNGTRSAPSNAVTYTTPPDTTAPSPAPVVSTTGVFAARISISWSKSTDNLSQVWYTVFHNGAPVNESQLGFFSSTFFYLQPQSTHTFRVDARDASGNVAQGNTISVTTPAKSDNTPPSAPTNLHTTFQSNGQEAWIEWSPSTDETDAQNLILYEVYLAGALVGDGNVGGTNTIAYCRDIGPMEILLRAVDTSGNRSDPSNAIVFDCG